MTQSISLATHSGSFHADDVLGYTILKAALRQHFPLGEHRPAITLTRTRDQNVIAEATIVWDVGGLYQPRDGKGLNGRYDHHMRDKAQRDDGVPYSSAGLLWRDYGHEAIMTMIDTPLPEDEDDAIAIINAIWQDIDTNLIRTVDVADNGVEVPAPDSLTMLVDAYNPVWDIPDDMRLIAEQAGWSGAVELVERSLTKAVRAVHATLRAELIVQQAFDASADPRLLELPVGCPWKEATHKLDLPVLFAIYPNRDSWKIEAMTPEPNSYGQRLPLPAEWAGLRDQDLSCVVGIPDAVFCHPGRFIAGAVSRDSVMKMAEMALSQDNTPSFRR
jgi:uncharacterized UPF0160 family protein